MRLLLLCYFLVQAVGLFAQHPLPIVQNQKWGLATPTGKILCSPQYDKVVDFREGYARMQLNGRVGLLDTAGREVLSPQYDFISLLNNELDTAVFIVEQQGQWNVVAAGDQLIIPDFQGELRVFPGGFIGQYRSQDSSLWRMPGQQVVPQHFIDLKVLDNDYLLLRCSQQQAIYHKDGSPFIPFQYRRIEHSPYGYWKIMPDKSWGLLNSSGTKKIIEARWSDLEIFHPRYAQVRDSMQRDWQFIPLEKGKAVNFYADAFKHYGGDTLAYKRYGRWGLVHASGERLTEPIFDQIRTFADSLFYYKDKRQIGLVTATGRTVQEAQYDSISAIFGDIALAFRTETIVEKDRVSVKKVRDIISRSGSVVVKDIIGELDVGANEVRQIIKNRVFIYSFTDKGSRYKRERIGQKHVIRITGGAANTGNLRNVVVGNLANARSDSSMSFPFRWTINRNPELGQVNKWGLIYRDSIVDSALVFALPPVFKSIKRPYRTPSITFVAQDMRIPGTDESRTLWGIVSNTVGKPISRFNIETIHFQEFRQRPVARCVFEGGTWGIIDSVGKIIAKGYSYIAPFQGNKAIACKKGREVVKPKEDATITEVFNELRQIPPTSQSLEKSFQESASAKSPKARWGFLNLKGQRLFKFDLEKVAPYVDGAALARKGGKWGLIDTFGVWLIEPIYEDVEYVAEDPKLLLFKQSHWGVGAINQRGQLIVPIAYERMLPQQEGFFALRKEGKWGFMDTTGQLRIPFVFDRLQSFSEGLAAARKDGKWGFIDTAGKWLIPPQYSRVGDFHEDHTWVFNRQGRYYINKKGQKVLEGDFLKTSRLCQGRVVVRDRKQLRLLMLDGTEVFKSSKLRFDDFVDNRFVRLHHPNGKHQLMDLNGKWVSGPRFRQLYCFKEATALAIHERKRFLVDTNGQFTRVPYTTLDRIGDNRIPYRARVPSKDGERKINAWGYLNLAGEPVIQPSYELAQTFKDGKAVVYKAHRFHLIDTLGNVLLTMPHKHRLIDQSAGRLLIKKGRRYHFSSTNLLHLLPLRYEDAEPFRNGVAPVRRNGSWGLIHKNGLTLCSPKFHEIEDWENGFAEVRTYYNKALFNRAGEELVPAICDRVDKLSENIVRVEAGNQVGYLDFDGNWIWPLQE